MMVGFAIEGLAGRTDWGADTGELRLLNSAKK